MLSSSSGSQSEHPCHFFCESHTSRAMNASIHDGGNEGTNVFVFDSSLLLIESPRLISIGIVLVLEVAFSSLVANRTIERVIGQQKLHDSSSRDFHLFRECLDPHVGHDLSRTRGHWLWRSLNFHETHSAVSSNGELFVVAKPGNDDTVLVAGLEDGEVGRHLVGNIVDEYLDVFGEQKLGSLNESFSE